MGEYDRLNKMLAEMEEARDNLRDVYNKSDEEFEALIDLEQSIGEIKGALLEMAEVDGLDDPYEAFDYCDFDNFDEYEEYEEHEAL